MVFNLPFTCWSANREMEYWEALVSGSPVRLHYLVDEQLGLKLSMF